MEPIPVICDRCRATGLAGEDPFADLADLLSFTPVPRRPHANGWTPEYQRAFIAALCATGSAPRAARAIGKHAFGAEQLRRAKGGSSFAAAWDAALDIARERELAGLADGLAELAAEQDEERQHRRSAILPATARAYDPAFDSAHPEPVEARARRLTKREEEDAEFDARREDYLDERARIRSRLTRARRLYLANICDDLARRAAWELLVGPVDWDSAERFGPQADEPFDDGERSGYDMQPHSFLKPALLMTAEAGLLADITGGPDALDELRAAMAGQAGADAEAPLPLRERVGLAPLAGEGVGTPEEQAAITAHRERLIGGGEADLKAPAAERRGNVGGGWTEDDDGNLWSPERDQ